MLFQKHQNAAKEDIVKFPLFCQLMSAPGAQMCQALWPFCESPAWCALEWRVEALTEPREGISPLSWGRRVRATQAADPSCPGMKGRMWPSSLPMTPFPSNLGPHLTHLVFPWALGTLGGSWGDSPDEAWALVGGAFARDLGSCRGGCLNWSSARSKCPFLILFCVPTHNYYSDITWSGPMTWLLVLVSRTVYLNLRDPFEPWGPLDDELQIPQTITEKSLRTMWILKDNPFPHLNNLISHLILELSYAAFESYGI